MFTRKEILAEIRESTSKAKIPRRYRGKIFAEPKGCSAKTLVVAKS